MFEFPAPKPKNKMDRYLQRSIEMLPGMISWTFLIGGVFVSIKAPVIVAVFIIIFDLYWMVKVFYITAFAVYGYRRMKLWENIDWLSRCKGREIKKENLGKHEEPSFCDIYHLIILPTYKEGVDVLKSSLDSIVKSNYPKEKMIVVLAFEERAGDEALARAKELEEIYANKFFAYLTTVHPDGIEGEAKVKGANTSWAAEEARIFLDEKGIKYENVIVSAFDSDTCAHREYFGCLAYHFMKSPDRHQMSYQPLPLYNNNIWQANSIVRVIMVSSSFWQIMQSVRYDEMVTFSSHSMSFKTLVDVNYWPRDMISDDSIIYWKCFSFYYGDYHVQPIYLPVSLDAVVAENFLATIANQYKQQRRWAWGIENIPIIYRTFLKNNRISFAKKIFRGWEELIGRISWGLTPIIISFFGWLPIILGGSGFNQTVLAMNLPKVLGYLMTFATVGLIVSMFLSIFLLPKAPQRTSYLKKAVMIFQWILAPIIAVPLGAFPMLDAQTRMLFGKYMEFWVTKKVRMGE